MSEPSRVPPGVKTGGQFAASAHVEGEVELEDVPVEYEKQYVTLYGEQGEFEVLDVHGSWLSVREPDGRTRVARHYELSSSLDIDALPPTDPAMYRGQRMRGGIGPNLDPRDVDPGSLTEIGDAGIIRHNEVKYTMTLVEYQAGNSRYGFAAQRTWLVSDEDGLPLAHMHSPGWMSHEGRSKWHTSTLPLPDRASQMNVVETKTRYDAIDYVWRTLPASTGDEGNFTVRTDEGVAPAY